MLRLIRKTLNNERGFTLIELMMVLMILGILVSIAIPRFTGKISEAEDVKTQADIKIIQNAVDLYFLDYGAYPSATAQLVEEGYLRQDPVQVDGTSRYKINSTTGVVSTTE
ncbi:MAG: prepilin-type N-terminal cleavage/methylation domain-containing protein [Dehalobacterium sp.]